MSIRKIYLAAGVSLVAFIGGVPAANAHGECMSCSKTVELMATEGKILGAISAMEASISAMLSKGFGTISNNIKSQTDALGKMYDEMNKDRVTSDRQRGIGEARGEYRYNDAECSPVVAGLQSQNVSWMSGNMAAHVSGLNDRIFRGYPGTPGAVGGQQAAFANFTDATKKYCNPVLAAAGLCTISTEKFSSVPGVSYAGANMNAMTVMHPNLVAYADEKEEQAANDFLRTLVDPVTPKPDNEIRDSGAQRAYSYRMGRDAGLSVSNGVISKQIAARTKTFEVNKSPLTKFTDMQERYLESIKRPITGKFSERELTDMEVNRRYGNLDWGKSIQRMNTNNLGKENVQLLAFQNHLLHRLSDKIDDGNLLLASILAGQRKTEQEVNAQAR